MSAAGRNAVLDDEDAALWAHVAAHVKPLRKAAKPSAPRKVEKVKRAEPVAIAPRVIAMPPMPPPRAVPKPLTPDSRERLPRTAERRLRRGSVEVAGRLDLHGLRRDEAHRAVTRFLSKLIDDGGRVALIITGKGAIAGEGVLRGELPRWLSEGTLARSVLAWRPAAPRHGGQGAFYVLLRRKTER